MAEFNDFDETSDMDFSTILKDIDEANLALDALDGTQLLWTFKNPTSFLWRLSPIDKD